MLSNIHRLAVLLKHFYKLVVINSNVEHGVFIYTPIPIRTNLSDTNITYVLSNTLKVSLRHFYEHIVINSNAEHNRHVSPFLYQKKKNSNAEHRVLIYAPIPI